MEGAYAHFTYPHISPSTTARLPKFFPVLSPLLHCPQFFSRSGIARLKSWRKGRGRADQSVALDSRADAETAAVIATTLNHRE